MLWIWLPLAESITLSINNVTTTGNSFEEALLRTEIALSEITTIDVLDGTFTQADGEFTANLSVFVSPIDSFTFCEAVLFENHTLPLFAFQCLTCVNFTVLSMDCWIIGGFAFVESHISGTFYASNVTELGYSVFYSAVVHNFVCESITVLSNYSLHYSYFDELILPNVRTIGSKAFNGAFVQQFEVNMVEKIESETFSGIICFFMTLAHLTEIPESAFASSTINVLNLPSVTKIGPYAFVDSSCLNISMNSVKEIPDMAFYSSGVNQIEANLVVSIGELAFEGSNLCQGIFPSLVNVSDRAFHSCFSLENLTTGTLCYIGLKAFKHCDALNMFNYSFSDDIMIDTEAFYECKSLRHIDTSSFTVINEKMFYNCHSLVDLDLSHVTRIDDWGLFGCFSLTDVNVSGVTHVAQNAFCFCTHITEISLPQITSVPLRCFCDMVSLVKIDISSAESLADYSLYNCYMLREIDISAVYIGEYSFSYCKSLTKVVLNSAEVIGSYCFIWCESLREVFLNKVTNLSTFQFSGLGITNIHADALECVPYMCFHNCGILERVTIPNCKIIESCAFEGASCLDVINFPELSVIKSSAFLNAVHIRIRIGALEEVGSFAFCGIRHLELNFVGSDKFSCKIIGESVFDGTSFDTDSQIDLEVIEELSGCIAFKREAINLPRLKIARNCTFRNTSELQTLVLNSLTVCDNCLAYNCPNLDSIITPNLTNVTNGTLVRHCNNLANLTFPQLKTVCEEAFANMISLVGISVTLMNRVSDSCFAGCTNLESVDLSSDLSVIGNFAFFNCHSLHIINEENAFNFSKVTTFGKSAFYKCWNITSVTLQCDEIRDSTFFGCRSLVNVSMDHTELIEASVFELCASLVHVTVSRVQIMHEMAFKDCSLIESLDLSRLTNLVGDEHFYRCVNLRLIVFPMLQRVSHASYNIFAECLSLETIYLGDFPPEEFHPDVFVRTNRGFIEVAGVDVINISLCLDNEWVYDYYKDRSSKEEGCDSTRWKYLHVEVPDSFSKVCPLGHGLTWMQKYSWLALSLSCFIGLTIIVGGVTFAIISWKRNRARKNNRAAHALEESLLFEP